MPQDGIYYKIDAIAVGQQALQEQIKETRGEFSEHLSKLTEAITVLARHDERLASHNDIQHRIIHRQDGADARQDQFEAQLHNLATIIEVGRAGQHEGDGANPDAGSNKKGAWIGGLSAAGGMVLGAIIIKGLGV